jgi:hypothetical protein
MKNAIIVPLFLSVVLFSCGNEPVESSVTDEGKTEQSDLAAENARLRKELSEKDTAINQAVRMFNEIEDNLGQIAEKQGLIGLSTKDPELGTDEKSRIIDDIQLINSLLEENKLKVNALRGKLKNADVKMGELEKMLERLVQDVAEKEKTINELREDLAKYDIAMDELTATVNLMQEEITEKDDELNTAYYVVGSSKELKEAGIITKTGGFIGIGKIKKLREDFNKDYFTKIDIRQVKTITLGAAKKAEILTSHPKNSYKTIGTKNPEKLEVINAKDFWGASKYLVVVIE